MAGHPTRGHGHGAPVALFRGLDKPAGWMRKTPSQAGAILSLIASSRIYDEVFRHEHWIRSPGHGQMLWVVLVCRKQHESETSQMAGVPVSLQLIRTGRRKTRP
jgi:hypothetical protein